MRVKTKRRPGRNDLVVVIFEEDSNFNPDDLSWVPTKDQISEICWTMKRVGAWD